MRIGVVSDTHSLKIPQQILDDFSKVDCIIHAGDFCSLKELETFKRLTEVKAVYGNMDDHELRRLLPERLIFKLEDVTIGLYHGDGPPDKLLDVMKAQFKKDQVDVIIFGHSHHPVNQTMNNVLFFNPGSPNDMIIAPYPSYGILEIKKGKVTGKIIKIKERNG